jgi:hypothetical protein
MPNINSETGELITSNLSREEFFAAYNKATDAEKKQMLKQQKKVVENSFIENIRSILEIPENYATLVKPNDTALLQGLSEELEDKVSDFDKYEKVKQGSVHGQIPAFDYCKMIPEDYRLLAQFFDRVYRHTQGENVELEDIEVY